MDSLRDVAYLKNIQAYVRPPQTQETDRKTPTEHTQNILAEGWVDENVTSQNDGGLGDLNPPTRKGALNLDEDVENAINVSSNAVVSVGKIKVVF